MSAHIQAWIIDRWLNGDLDFEKTLFLFKREKRASLNQPQPSTTNQVEGESKCKAQNFKREPL